MRTTITLTVEANEPDSQALLAGATEAIELFYGRVVDARLVESTAPSSDAPVSQGPEHLDVAAARHELWKHLNGYVCHMPEDDEDWMDWTDAILRAALTGESSPLIR